MRLACTYVLSTKCESRVVIRNSCSLLARSGHTKEFAILAPVVQTLDSAIQRINHYPADKY